MKLVPTLVVILLTVFTAAASMGGGRKAKRGMRGGKGSRKERGKRKRKEEKGREKGTSLSLRSLFHLELARVQMERRESAEVAMFTFAKKANMHNSGTGFFNLHVLDGMWHLVCFTGRSSSGDWKMYKDGCLVTSGTASSRGGSVDPSGVWILGQDQDTPGGAFQLNQAFSGDISNFNVWDYVMTESQILQQFMNDSSYHGNVIDWETVGKLVFGGVQLYQVDCETSLGQDPCNITDDEICDTAYNNTIVDPNRSTAFVPGPSDLYICDNRLTKGWYRFEAHSQSVRIPEVFVEPYHCGTRVPLWLDGPHPINSQVADRVVCANYGVPGNYCSNSIPILVKKCADNAGLTSMRTAYHPHLGVTKRTVLGTKSHVLMAKSGRRVWKMRQ
ncbi:hypothetical protein Bbelb_066060 [Branchiostoma belcheri]|nr:hypothetical protein Bbelb_066060 [Branchiostoma belcheri]